MTELMDLPKVDPKPIRAGRIKTKDEFRKTLKGKRFLITTAQNNTTLHEQFWKTLLKMKNKLRAQLIVCKTTYNKNGWQKITADSDDVWFDPKLDPYLMDEPVKLADGLVLCADLDILPTAVTPLNGLDNYTGVNSAIVPHVKQQMKSLATMKHEPAKLMYTTGACTLINYIQRRAGQIAEFHHIYGALLVEVADDGKWFVRQLNADEQGNVYDLDVLYTPTKVKNCHEAGTVEAITLGDIHLEKIDHQAFAGALDMIAALRPKYVMLHDLIDFKPRNHHNLHDVKFLVGQYAKGEDSVQQEIVKTALFLHGLHTTFPDVHFHVIKSNHDEAFDRWVNSPMKFIDPPNMRYWHECNARLLLSTEQQQDIDIFYWAVLMEIQKAGLNLPSDRVTFVQDDQSVLISGIEYGMHGHLGPNGARGNPRGFRQIGRRANTGHTHSAGIIDGIYTGGVLGSLDMGYNRGPSSWSHSSIVTYSNAKRAIVTQHGGRWRAGPEQ